MAEMGLRFSPGYTDFPIAVRVCTTFSSRKMATQINKKRKFVADGVFFVESNKVLTRELAEDGYSGVEIRVSSMRMEIIIRATRTQNVLGICLIPFLMCFPLFMTCCCCYIQIFVWFDFDRREGEEDRIRELTSVVHKRFKFPENNVELYSERVNNRGQCAIVQAESLRYKLLGGLAVRRPDHNLQDVRTKIFPSKRIKAKTPEPEIVPPVTLPAKRKERSISS